ncbi:1-deoxy-D-xylulose-5-phosphate synthase [Leptospira inadai serovar Lyme str. 10]|uniref:1-deoxy-D-xylulose-5-phosphate synthase n=2 Tax=Leptospira inadai serovar Lyme TaxID=293084 RepID=V6HAZ3_9LEPT|nr:1-deoxy-D-xylulose-5-phosphate synthase [Leptospira inadai]EQA36462.1 1-deoxy-D-xylulose-5-phosphate synthase [Leptospira inadai serovar Lyme str. 10]PNV76409.1 1-deoxy-D-xylulose-5-phosphate synthase [Leptospira inadai serovar Lyme]
MQQQQPNLDGIRIPADLRKLPLEELPRLCAEVRNYIIDTLSGIGGHFASNLGVVELTVALHYVFDTPNDRLIWDVGHQTYPHKILTGRKDKLSTVRKFKGLSGFPKREESVYDLYNTGHAGTSISQALGEAVARDLTGKNYNVVAIIGDASIATGMALEALNHAGHLKKDLLVILNDNYMSISKNVGSISSYLNNIISSHFYLNWKRIFYTFLKWFPIVGPAMESFFKKVEKGFKDVFTPGGLFEDLGFGYIGPEDGHDVIRLVTMLRKLKTMKGPVLFHVITQKGKGYSPAEKDPIKYHGVTPFRKEDGAMDSGDDSKISYSKIVGKVLTQLTEKNPKIAAITPAMIEGSGLGEYVAKFPDHVFDVGIAEQHSVAFAGAMTNGDIIPYMCIYSTFLTRAMDQLVEDVSLMNLPVRFVIDRAGCVGPDGETHQGLFDLNYLLSLPNMDVFVPSSGQDLVDSLRFLETYDKSPIAIRFPKASVDISGLDFSSKLELNPGSFRVLRRGSDIAILSIGSMLDEAKKAAAFLENEGLSVALIDLVWLRPLGKEALDEELSKVRYFTILDESYVDGGASGYLLNRISPEYLSRFLKTFGFPSEPIHHGERKEIFLEYGLDGAAIARSLLGLVKKEVMHGKHN